MDTVLGTKYTVIDNRAFSNRDGGAADRHNMTDTIYYETIDEPGQTMSGDVTPRTGYHTFTNGLLGLVIHEAVHRTAGGDDFYRRSLGVARRDPQVQVSLYSSTDPGAEEYSDNVEAFTSAFSRRIHADRSA